MKRAAIAAQHRVSKPYRRLSTAVFETLADGSIGENLLILPCNRVVRVMDFDQDATTVCIRPGFSAEFMLKDIALRSDDQQAPFHKILAFSDDGSWLQEELVDGRPLFRATRDPDALGRWMLETLAVLETWQTASARRVDARCYVNALVNRIQAGFQESRAATRCALSTLPNGLLGSAKKAAASSPELLLVQGHRDLSPKNVIIRRDTGRPVILDWELSDESFQYFDRMCLGLGALDLLPEPGLELRLQRFLSARDDNEFLRALPTDGAWRALAGGVFALELVCWLLHMMDDYSGAYATELEACLNSLHRVDWAKG
ncbi:MAG: hypothetical protein A2W26_08620 [Acidobacteria bacterium RBG_16_64_8]|nr:MAG: hypothetical protein A2W26_08620 [Acidobacteria bacterium RBG_16_64_8]